MEKENRLQLQYCPKCAKTLKTAGDTRKLICPHCLNPIRPSGNCPQTTPVFADHKNDISNIRSAYSYFRVFTEDFDWDLRILHNSYTLEQIDSLVSRFRLIAADDVLTWKLAFESIYIPTVKKIQGFSSVLDKVADLYLSEQKNDARLLFDSLCQTVAYIKDKQEDIFLQLDLFIKNATICRADDATLDDLRQKTLHLHSLIQEINIPKSAEDIPAIKTMLDENNRRMIGQFAEIGIDLELEYRRIGNFLAQKQIKEAVAALERIRGYKNTKTLLNDINRCYRFGEVLQIAGRLFMEKGNNLYAIDNGKPSAEPCIRSIANFLGIYADRLFYTDSKNKLFCFDLSEKTTTEFDRKRTFPDLAVVDSDDPCTIYFTYRSKDGKGPKVLASLNPVTFSETVLFENTEIIHSIQNGILVYSDNKGETFAATLADKTLYSVCRNRIDLCCIAKNSIIYTRNAPSADNKNLYLFRMEAESQEQTLATNIRAVCHADEKNVFYTIGNHLSGALYAADIKSATAKQISKSAYKVAFTDPDAVYGIIGDNYNRSLSRIATANGMHTQLTDSLLKTIGLYCGKIFYTDAESNLCSVLPDGTDRTVLFADVREVFIMHDGKIRFTAADEIHISRDETGTLHRKEILSLYCISHDGGNLQKLAHDISAAQCYNKKEIDFFKSAPTANGSMTRWMFRHDTATEETFKLLEYTINDKKGK